MNLYFQVNKNLIDVVVLVVAPSLEGFGLPSVTKHYDIISLMLCQPFFNSKKDKVITSVMYQQHTALRFYKSYCDKRAVILGNKSYSDKDLFIGNLMNEFLYRN